ncbi:MAG: hypothetical protein ABIF77_02385 [bacterium]
MSSPFTDSYYVSPQVRAANLKRARDEARDQQAELRKVHAKIREAAE